MKFTNLQICLFSLLFLFIQIPFVFAKETVNPCRTAWNNRMQTIDDQYQQGLTTLLFQKQTTSQIIQSEAISNNLRNYNCQIHQVCALVHLSLASDSLENLDENKINISPWRCAPKTVKQLGGILPECSKEELKTQAITESLWNLCESQAQSRNQDIEIITELEVLRSYQAKKTSNFVGYLINLNVKMEKLTLNLSNLIGRLFAVTKKLNCIQKNCQ